MQNPLSSLCCNDSELYDILVFVLAFVFVLVLVFILVFVFVLVFILVLSDCTTIIEIPQLRMAVLFHRSAR